MPWRRYPNGAPCTPLAQPHKACRCWDKPSDRNPSRTPRGLARSRQLSFVWSSILLHVSGESCSYRWSANRIVAQSDGFHLVELVEIPAVHDHRLLENALDAVKIGVPILVPVGHDDERIGTFERIIVSLGIFNTVAKERPALL